MGGKKKGGSYKSKRDQKKGSAAAGDDTAAEGGDAGEVAVVEEEELRPLFWKKVAPKDLQGSVFTSIDKAGATDEYDDLSGTEWETRVANGEVKQDVVKPKKRVERRQQKRSRSRGRGGDGGR